MDLILDTCTVLWAASAPERIPDRARQAMVDPDARVCVSAICAAELACGVARGRIQLTRHWKPWFRLCLAENGWECLPIDLDVMEEAYSLPEPFHQDPADRILVATARTYGLHVVTADRRIIDFPHVRCLWE